MDLPRVGDEAERARLRPLPRAAPASALVVGAGGRWRRQRRLREEDLGRRRWRRVGGGGGAPVAGAGELLLSGGHVDDDLRLVLSLSSRLCLRRGQGFMGLQFEPNPVQEDALNRPITGPVVCCFFFPTSPLTLCYPVLSPSSSQAKRDSKSTEQKSAAESS